MSEIPAIFAVLSGWACTGGLPFVLTVLACIDIGRRGEAWWWYAVVLFFPVVGPIAYFIATRRFGGSVDSRGSLGQRRRHAQARLRDLEVQLAHWRGPAVLAESGEELLTLGRNAEAEARFREARQAGAPPEDVNLGLAEALVAQGRAADAVAPLQELVAQHPDHGMGRAALLLARCLDDTDRATEAEAQLRVVLARRNEPEARVRLARRLLLRGERAEGEALAREVVDEARLLSPALRRVHAPWTRAARRLLGGKLDLPRVSRASSWIRTAVIVVAVLVALMVVGVLVAAGLIAMRIHRADAEARRLEAASVGLLEELESEAPPRADDLAALTLSEQEVSAYAALRRDWIGRRAEHAQDWELEPGDAYLLGERKDLGSYPEVVLRRTERARELIEACAEHGIAPSRLVSLLATIEWRFLGRQEALAATLPDAVRASVVDEQELVARLQRFESSPPTEELARIEGWISLAPRDRTLHPETMRILEAHRAELEALEPGGVATLLSDLRAIDRLEQEVRFHQENPAD